MKTLLLAAATAASLTLAAPIEAAAPLTVTVQQEYHGLQVFGYLAEPTSPFRLKEYYDYVVDPGNLSGEASLDAGLAKSSVTQSAVRSADNRAGSGSIETFHDYSHDPQFVGASFASGLYGFQISVDRPASFDLFYDFVLQGDLPEVLTLADMLVSTRGSADAILLDQGSGRLSFRLDPQQTYFFSISLWSDHFQQSQDQLPRGMSQASLTFSYAVAALPSPVPEPQLWALMIAGFGLAGAGLRRRPNLRARRA